MALFTAWFVPWYHQRDPAAVIRYVPRIAASAAFLGIIVLLAAFCLIFQAIAIGFYPALFAAGFLERVPMSDHAEMDMPPPILARNILMKAMGCLISTNGEILFRFIKPIRRSGSRNGQAE